MNYKLVPGVVMGRVENVEVKVGAVEELLDVGVGVAEAEDADQGHIQVIE